MKRYRKLATLAGCAVCAVFFSAASFAAEPSAPEPAGREPSARESSASEPARQRGVWQKHEYSFAFMGFTSTYSCDGLADKIKMLLIAAGARPDAKSRPGACASGFGRPDKFARADLTFYSLTPGATDPPADNKPVDGVWRSVVFSDHSPRDLHTGDCELIEQFRNSVLPMFTTRNVDDRTTCVPHQDSGSNISLRFESLAPAPGKPHTGAAPVM
jgi:hypothetical protein